MAREFTLEVAWPSENRELVDVAIVGELLAPHFTLTFPRLRPDEHERLLAEVAAASPGRASVSTKQHQIIYRSAFEGEAALYTALNRLARVIWAIPASAPVTFTVVRQVRVQTIRSTDTTRTCLGTWEVGT